MDNASAIACIKGRRKGNPKQSLDGVKVYLLQPRFDNGDRDTPTVLLHVIIASLLIEVSPQGCHVTL